MAASKQESDLGPQQAYLRRLGVLLRAVLGGHLIGVYAGGSYALGDFDPEASDLDVAAVVESEIGPAAKQLLAARLGDQIPPARGLELVVYRFETARSSSAGAGFELNLNIGAELAPRVDRAPGSVPGHWFPIDRSMLAQGGVALIGPPADEVFAAVDRSDLLPVLIESVRWHRNHSERPGDSVLGACRSLLFASEGRWASKREAGGWAVDRGAAPAKLVQDALAARRGDAAPDAAAVAVYLDEVEARLIGLRR